MNTADKVKEYLDKKRNWSNELMLLRKLVLSTGLEEKVKWGAPVYTLDGKNVVGLGAFKSYVGLWFFNGALLKDKSSTLVNAQKGVTKAMRQWRFTDYDNIESNKKHILSYIKEAIGNQREGREIKASRNKPLLIPPVLQHALKEKPLVNKAFHSFSIAKRREFAEYISSAKQLSTRTRRLEKILPMILDGVGLNDKYR